ncbi:MAG TPA: alpha/beta fold hydrolase [Usitatibacter sp.]|nr:alpha/beta fold hydrolase [Usitatibacter sp.]
MDSHAHLLKPPNAMLLALEGRAPWELGASVAAYPLLRFAPRGDGHAVLVFPGLATSDITTLPLRAFLAERGYRPRGWEMRLNLGPRDGVIDRCLDMVHRLRRETRRKVSLVGWSLGGVYARELAKLAPENVRCVVTLGSPFTGHPKANNAWRIYELASGHSIGDGKAFRRVREAPPVPTTSIFSRSDGIVAWRCCVQEPGPIAESIEVAASHIGMGLNPAAWYAVADRLAQREGRWKPFHREGWRQWLYRDPHRADGRG